MRWLALRGAMQGMHLPGNAGRLTPKKAIAFDLDSTLVDFMRIKELACEEAALAMVDAGLDMEPAEAKRLVLETYFDVGIESDRAFAIFLERRLGRADPQILAAGVQAYLRAKYGHLAPYPRVVPTLLALKRQGFVLGVITDAERFKAMSRLAATGLLHYFDIVITHDDTLNGKGDDMPFLRFAKAAGARTIECVMVGDNPGRDIRPANRLGMTTVLAAYGEQADFRSTAREDQPDYRIHRFEELVDVVLPQRGLGHASPPPLPAAVPA